MKRTAFTMAGILFMLIGTSVLVAQDASQRDNSPEAADQAAAPAAAGASEHATAAAATEAAKPADQPAAPAAKTPAGGPKAEAFDELFSKWKKILTELRDLKYKQYPEAEAKSDVNRLTEISKRYADLIAQGETMQGNLVAAAVGAFKEAPNQNPEITRFLLGILSWDSQADDYEEAVGLGQSLIDGGLQSPQVYALTGEAAFCTNQFDLAEKYLKLAKDGGALDEKSEAHQAQIGYYEAQWAKEKKIREAEAKADDLPRVEITTKHGKMIVELFENEAPNTVANFISLVKKGFYDGLTFHRVLPGFMAQGGCPEGTGNGGPGYRIECECVQPNSRKHFRGSLSMAHAGPDTGGSQFFLCFAPAIGLDGPPSPNHHTVFGRVVEGLDQLAKIKRRDPEKENPGEPDKIISMKVIRDRGHEYEPKTLPALR